MVTKPMAHAASSPAPSSSSSSRPHSITVFGCTGNAGRAVAYHCVRAAVIRAAGKGGGGGKGKGGSNNDEDRRSYDDDIVGATTTRPAVVVPRIALAGRNREAVTRVLNGILDELRVDGVLRRASSTSPSPSDVPGVEVEIVIADATDHDSMLEMARSTNVLVSCAGPYGRYGESSVRACVEGGAHYVDITGEVNFVERMIGEYGEYAEMAGVTLCSFSGYDCVPAELGMWLVGRTLEAEGGGGGDDDDGGGGGAKFGRLELNFGGKGGGFPRGTLNTILDGVEGNGSKRKDGDPRFYPEEYRDMARDALSPLSFVLPKYQMGQFTGPNFMSVVNVPVLCRAAPRLGFSSDVTISDRLTLVARPSLINGYGLFVAQFYIGLLLTGGMSMMIGPFRTWLRRRLETYGYHGDPSGKVYLDARGTSSAVTAADADDDDNGKGGAYATAKFRIPGDPGVYATGLLASGVACALLEATSTESTFPLPLVGFHSPVAALHVCRPGLLVDHLRGLGARITVEFAPREGVAARTIDVAKLRSNL